MNLNIVHIATDAIAGMPFRLVEILQKHTPFNARLIDLKKRDVYPQDIVFVQQKEEAISLIQKADIIHLHNNIDLNSTDFSPINFRELEQKGTRFVRQFHSVPETIARKMGCAVEEILSDSIPSVVIGQYPERYYPNARVIPNCIPINDPLYIPTHEKNIFDVIFTPSKASSAWSARWGTKGMPETVRMLNGIKKKSGARIEVVTKRPLNEVLSKKQHAYIVLEEMITGSYHLSGLEGLSMGKPTYCYLDKRNEKVMKYLSGSSEIPFINTMLENSEKVILYLLSNREEGDAIGRFSREWMVKYWNEEVLVGQYIDMYNNLMQNPDLVTRQPELRIDDMVNHFHSITANDLLYASRCEKQYFTSFSIKVGDVFRSIAKGLRRHRKSLKKVLSSIYSHGK